MSPASSTLKALISTLAPRRKLEQVAPNVRDKDGSSPAILRPDPTGPSGQSSLTLETLNHDVLRLIALELYRLPRDLKRFASCSRTIRDIASPILFSRCRRRLQYYPPDTISSFARYLTFTGGGDVAASNGYCKRLLDCFPLLTAITFEDTAGLSWDVLQVFLSRPRITSISFGRGATLSDADAPLPAEAADSPIALFNFAYNPGLWRAERHRRNAGYYPPRDLDLLVAQEYKCLAALVPHMNHTLAQLSLTIQSAPIPKIIELPWPKLRVLSIYGTYWTAEQVDSLPVLLGALPNLETLSIRISRELSESEPRKPMLGRHLSPRSVLRGMRSLTVAYPRPDDDIFNIDTSRLRHLSICDWQRHYNSLAYQNRHSAPYAYPILSSTECLSILRRMDLPELSSLELVYLADRPGADDDLLRYVAREFPQLAHLELHRYRADRKEVVDHAHIARLLTAARSLRTVRLNLDFLDDHGPYCGAYAVRKAWWDTFKGTLGWEIVDIMQDCPLLRCVELLYHGSPTATWAEFHPPRCAEPRFVLSYDSEHREPELMPVSWFNVLSFGPWNGYPEQDLTAVQSAWHAEESSESDSSGSEDSTPPPEDAA